MAITFKTAINRVLVKLRESEVTNLTSASTYQKLVAAFVNEAKEEVESAWTWNALYDKEVVTTVAGTAEYGLLNWGDELSIDSVYNSTNNTWMRGPMPNWKINQWSDIASSSGTSLWWDIYQQDSNGDAQIRFWPTPDGVYTINVYGFHHQTYLTTASDSETVILVPWKPVVYGAYYRAISERGEDGGQLYDETVKAYQDALSDAVALDAAQNNQVSDWHNNDLNLRSSNYIGLP